MSINHEAFLAVFLVILKKMATLTVPGLKPEEVNDMKAAFTIFEANLRGAIQKSTLANFYKKFGKDFSDDDLQ